MKAFRSFSILIFLLSFIVFGSLSVGLGKDDNRDLRSYHFYNGYAIMNNRLDLDYAPAMLQTYLNPVSDMLFYSLVTNFSPRIVGFLMGGIHGINFWLIYLIAFYTLKLFPLSLNDQEIDLIEHRAIKGKIVGDGIEGDIKLSKPGLNYKLIGISLAISMVGIYGPITLYEIGRTYNDNLVSLFTLGALLIILRKMSVREIFSYKDIRIEIILSGLLMGIAIGLKLTQAIYGVSLIIAIIVFHLHWYERLKSVLLMMFVMVGGVVLSAGYWMYIMWAKFESPLFPFYNKLFRSPYYSLYNIQDLCFIPNSLLQKYFYPFFFLFDNHYTHNNFGLRDTRFAIIYVLIGLMFFMIARNKFFKNVVIENEALKQLLTNISIGLMLLFIGLYPLWWVGSILEHRLVVQELYEHLSLAKYYTLILFTLIALIVILIVKNIGFRNVTNKTDDYSNSDRTILVFFLTFYVTSYVFWQQFFSIHRYLLPLEVISPLLIFILLTYLVKNEVLRNWYIYSLFIIIILFVRVPNHPIYHRINWGDSYFDVQIPDVEELNQSLVLMAGRDPISYLIPFFPAGARFIRIDRHFAFATASEKNKLTMEIRKLIERNDSPSYLMSRGMHLLEHGRILRTFGLSIENINDGIPIKSDREPAGGVQLWKLIKGTIEEPIR